MNQTKSKCLIADFGASEGLAKAGSFGSAVVFQAGDFRRPARNEARDRGGMGCARLSRIIENELCFHGQPHADKQWVVEQNPITRAAIAGADLEVMSRAFVKEDVDLPERSGRTRTSSGLPPGALNYITRRGERRLRERLAKLGADPAGHAEEIADFERLLSSVTVVDVPENPPGSVAFGATVRVRSPDGQLRTFRIVGVDEVEFEEDALSWISPMGRALLGAEIGERVRVEGEERSVTVLAIGYEEPAE